MDLYQRARLTQTANSANGPKTVCNVHSVLGQHEKRLVLGLICQKEDGSYYLEDSTFSVKVSFSELSYVEPDAFFTEMCIIMAEGRFESNVFFIHSVMHPPLHANKAFKFNLNEQDYFGSYTKLTESLMVKSKISINQPNQRAGVEMEPCVVVINQSEIDRAKNAGYFEELFQGLE